MKTLTQEDILNHKDLKHSLEVVDQVSKGIRGYVCHQMIHVLYVLKELMGDECKNYLEIGTHNGGSIMTVMQSEYETNFYGVDVWGGDVNRQYAQENITKHNKHQHNFELIKGNSMSDNTFNNVVKECPSVDFLFIDGGHTYENVINDFGRYSKLVNTGGLIVFDDYLMFERPNPFDDVQKERKGQVRLAVDDIVSKLGDSYNIIGILPNEAGAITNINIDYNVSFIIQKL